jgi:hypothetical protein
VLRARRLIPEGLENGFVLASVLLLFQACDAAVDESGILAVTVAGVVVGNLRSRADRDLREFKDQLTVLLIGLLFVLLAADVRIEQMLALGRDGLLVVALLVLVVRPLGVWLCTSGSEFTVRERIFVAWIAPRGIVAAAVASVTAHALTAAGDDGGDALRALVFLTIAGTVLLAGVTAAPVASLLGVRLPGRDRFAILGADGLGLCLGKWLTECGNSVVFLDSNPEHVRQAQEADIAVVFGDAVQERTMQRARFESVGSAVGMTPNQVLNSVFVSRARELFDVPQGYIAMTKAGSGIAPDLIERGEARVLFDGPHDTERWEVRGRHGEVDVEEWRVVRKPGEPEGAPKAGERVVLLGVRRGKRAWPMYEREKLIEGDRIAVAIHVPERAEAEAYLRWRGLEPPEPEAEEA